MAINDWMQGDGTDALQGTDDSYLIDDNVTAYLQNPLDLLLKDYQVGCGFDIASVTTCVIYPGQIVASNAGGTARRFRENTTNITIDITNAGAGGLDSNSTLAADTVYYVFITADTSDTAFNGIFTETTPSDVTYYRRVGYVKTNGSSEITSKGTYFTTGAIAQIVMTEHQGEVQYSGGILIPKDDTAPQSSEGHPYVELTTPIIPSRANATFIAECQVHATSPTALGQGQRMFLFKDGGSAIGGTGFYPGYGLGTSGNIARTIVLTFQHKFTTSSTTPFELTVNTSDYNSTSHRTGIGDGNNYNTYGDTLTDYLKVTELR